MRVLFIADIHIKVGQRNVPKEWQLQRYEELGIELSQLSEKVDLVILGGDIFDDKPSTLEIDVYCKLIKDIKCKCIVIDGNHEASARGATWLTNLKLMSKLINDNVLILDEACTYYGIQFLPYCKLKTQLETLTPESNILITHVRGAIEPFVKPEVNLEHFDKWEVVFAGDLHSHSNSQRNIVYPGSPLTTSFHRKPVETGVIIFETSNPLEYEFVPLELPQLIRKTVESEAEIKKTQYDHTIYELKGSTVSLTGVEDSELLDKKIFTKENKAKLDLSKSPTLASEVALYCEKVLNLGDDEIEEIKNVLGQEVDDNDRD